MGHTLPHALSASGSFAFTLEDAVRLILDQLYQGVPLPPTPQTDSTKTKSGRNTEIRARYAAGETVPELAEAYGISHQRIHQILQGKRK